MFKRDIFVFTCVTTGLFMAGCGPDLQKARQQSDKAVYDVIARNWQTKYGPHTDYKIDLSQAEAAAEKKGSELVRKLAEKGVLSLEDAVAAAAANNRQYQTEKETLYLKTLDFIDARHMYGELIPFATAKAGYVQEDKNAVTGVGPSVGFQTLLATGAKVGTSLTLNWLDIVSGDIKGGMSSMFDVVVSQPLLRGAGRKVALENLTQAGRDALYEVRSFNHFRRQFTVDIVSQYWRTVQMYDVMKNARQNLDTLEAIYQRAEKLANAGVLPRYELEQARQDRLNAEDIYKTAQKDYGAAMDEFKLQLAIPANVRLDIDENELEELRKRPLAQVKFGQEEAIEAALNQRLDLLNAADMVIDAGRKAEVAADAMRMGLDITAKYSPASEGRRHFGADPGDIRRTRRMYNLTTELDLPIDRTTEKNNYTRALIYLMQQQRMHEEVTQNVILEVTDSYRALNTARQRYAVQAEAMGLAAKRLENTRLLLQYARANTRDVLDAQKDLYKAQNASTASLVDYTIALLQFYRACGALGVNGPAQ